jgi:hypothetical protein
VASRSAEILHRPPLSGILAQLAQLARIADGETLTSAYLDPDKMPGAARNIVRLIPHFPDKLGHVKGLAAAGADYDRPDDAGITLVQIAGWEPGPKGWGISCL